MTKAVAIARHSLRTAVLHARAAIVLGCAIALILAGEALPL